MMAASVASSRGLSSRDMVVLLIGYSGDQLELALRERPQLRLYILSDRGQGRAGNVICFIVSLFIVTDVTCGG